MLFQEKSIIIFTFCKFESICIIKSRSWYGFSLDSISEFLNKKDRIEFKLNLEEVKNSMNMSEKIKVVKDFLPDSLKKDEFNPLKTLYDTLSEGIHEKSDSKCLEYSKLIRSCLEYLIHQIYLPNREKNLYTENMRKLISKRNKKKVNSD